MRAWGTEEIAGFISRGFSVPPITRSVMSKRHEPVEWYEYIVIWEDSFVREQQDGNGVPSKHLQALATPTYTARWITTYQNSYNRECDAKGKTLNYIGAGDAVSRVVPTPSSSLKVRARQDHK